MKPRKLTADEVTFTITVEPEEDQVAGNFATGDDELDRKLERDIIEAFNAGSVEAWCCIKVTATYQGFEGHDYLGCCSHLDGDDMPPVADQVKQTIDDCGMRDEALDDLNQTIAAAYDKLAPLLG